jgi:hypothetical protein
MSYIPVCEGHSGPLQANAFRTRSFEHDAAPLLPCLDCGGSVVFLYPIGLLG